MTDLKLRNCPFCSGDASIWQGKSLAGNILHQVICHKCKAQQLSFKTEQKAIKSWNTRAKPDLSDIFLDIECENIKIKEKYEKLLAFVKRVRNAAPMTVTDGIAMSAFELLKEIGGAE